MDKKRILIVEDNFDARELLVLVLRRSGYDIVEAATGLEAVDKARDEHPDLILMDLGLPGITGDEATARIKADRSTSNIPVIVNTAYNKGTFAVERAIAAGAAEIVQKPVNFKALQELVQRYLSPTYQRVDVSTETVNDSGRPVAAFV
jgi:CheY-like chemotaxis protein